MFLANFDLVHSIVDSSLPLLHGSNLANSDSYRLPCGMYYCCHLVESEASHDHVGIGVAVAILLVVFVLLVVGMIIWPID